MNHEETAKILAAIAARDQRTVGRADVLAWHEDIGDLDFADCLPAVSAHFRTSEARVMPVHIRRLVADLRQRRQERESGRAAIDAGYPADAIPGAEGYKIFERALIEHRRRKASAAADGARTVAGE